LRRSFCASIILSKSEFCVSNVKVLHKSRVHSDQLAESPSKTNLDHTIASLAMMTKPIPESGWIVCIALYQIVE
jgi:hypothetical protein